MEYDGEEKKEEDRSTDREKGNTMNSEEQIQQTVVRLSDLKLELAEQLEQAQSLLREYVVSKQYPIGDRFEVWSEWCKKKEIGWIIHETTMPLLGKLVDDNEPQYYDRYQDYDWRFFLEVFTTDDNEAAELRERYGVTVDDVKELLIEQNFGSYTHDW